MQCREVHILSDSISFCSVQRISVQSREVCNVGRCAIYQVLVYCIQLCCSILLHKTIASCTRALILPEMGNRVLYRLLNVHHLIYTKAAQDVARGHSGPRGPLARFHTFSAPRNWPLWPLDTIEVYTVQCTVIVPAPIGGW